MGVVLGRLPLRWRTRVRWRLLTLTSVPILVTLVGMLGLTLYWTLTYSWQNLLSRARADLGVAHQALVVQQEHQSEFLTHLRDSWRFQQQLRHTPQALGAWLAHPGERGALDLVRLRRDIDLAALPLWVAEQLQRGQSVNQFALWDEPALAALDPALARQARIGEETRAMVSLSWVPVSGPDGRLQGVLEGAMLINRNGHLVDRLRDQVFVRGTLPRGEQGAVTLFLGDLRVSTNVPADSEQGAGRAIGTRVSEPVRRHVLERGEVWVDRAWVHDAWAVSGYEPLHNLYGQVIGMLYVGFPEWPFVRTYLVNLMELGGWVVVILLFSGLLVYRGARDLFSPIEQIHRVVRATRRQQEARIGELGLDPAHELAQLGRQFDAMLDLLAERNRQIASAAGLLEEKVAERTERLHQKTAELEAHIRMLTEARQQLRVSEKLAALGELCAGVAHEINNPLAVILGNMELLKMELGESAPDEIEQVLAQVDRIRAITRSLLQYSRPGEYETPPVWQHLGPIIGESLTLVGATLRQQGVAVESRLAASAPVEADRQQLLQVMINLLVNAGHAIARQREQGGTAGRIEVTTSDWCERGEVCGAEIRVRDDGCGIPPALQDRIFEPFFTTRANGTGLGLALCYRIVDRWGGTLQVSSVPGEGSCFTVRLRSRARLKGVDAGGADAWRLGVSG
ncbi:sensor histidine kinase [Aeromonas schubertii]|uniref:histidine kinase n=2 Tax=Aeromonas TaxID=642 RepID=A0ABS7V8K0_9GAMM|nr:ATP-binding protein [Aeromonas schubertii]MBZ6065234.1 cache domain-containing protein [Aeromonas schubertii]QCG48759.1 HAMP domain-containing protein [Aeromonas schubertii]